MVLVVAMVGSDPLARHLLLCGVGCGGGGGDDVVLPLAWSISLCGVGGDGGGGATLPPTYLITWWL